MTSPSDFDQLVTQLKACRICRDSPRYGAALQHEPRPVIQGSASARLCIVSQAPGTRSHAVGIPFPDRSGARLRTWLGLDEATFYDSSRIALVPMGACFSRAERQGRRSRPAPGMRGNVAFLDFRCAA